MAIHLEISNWGHFINSADFTWVSNLFSQRYIISCTTEIESGDNYDGTI